MTTKTYDAASTRRQAGNPATKWLRRTGGVSAMLVGLVLFIAALDLLRAMVQPGIAVGWADWLMDNWLMVTIKLHAGFQDVHPGMLYELNFLDVVLMLLSGIAYLGMFAVLRKTSKYLTIIAAALPFLGLLLFIITQSFGRSAVMIAGLVISFVMVRSRIFSTNTAVLGIFASALLLVGDFTVANNPAYIFAFLAGLGYVLQTMWFFRVGRRLLMLKKRRRNRQEEQREENL